MVREITRRAHGARVDFAKESIARDPNLARGGILVYLKKVPTSPHKVSQLMIGYRARERLRNASQTLHRVVFCWQAIQFNL